MTQAIQIDIAQIEELYDSLSAKIYADMDKQYKEKKISGTTYATTWAALMQSVISGSLQAVVSFQTKETDADRCVKLAQCGLTKAQKDEIAKESARKEKLTTQQIASEKAKEAVLKRQEAGFDDNLRQKLFEAQMNAWALMFSSGLLEKMPCFIDSDEASKLYAGILKKTMPSYNPPVGSCKATP